MTQHELIIEYIRLKGYIIPAKLSDVERRFRGDFIGSQADKRCREMRKQIQGEWKNPYGRKMLDSEKEGKFEKFFLIPSETSNPAPPKPFMTATYTMVKYCCGDRLRGLESHAKDCRVEKVKERGLW